MRLASDRVKVADARRKERAANKLQLTALRAAHNRELKEHLHAAESRERIEGASLEAKMWRERAILAEKQINKLKKQVEHWRSLALQRKRTLDALHQDVLALDAEKGLMQDGQVSPMTDHGSRKARMGLDGR